MKLLDTSAWIEYFKSSEKGVKIKELLKKEQVYTNILCFAELSKWCCLNKVDNDFVVKTLKNNGFIIEINESLLIESGKLQVELRKRRSAISLIDTIIYFSARVNDLVLVTADNDFKGLENVDLI